MIILSGLFGVGWPLETQGKQGVGWSGWLEMGKSRERECSKRAKGSVKVRAPQVKVIQELLIAPSRFQRHLRPQLETTFATCGVLFWAKIRITKAIRILDH
jgi:hypothetical protein